MLHWLHDAEANDILLWLHLTKEQQISVGHTDVQ